MLNQQCTVLTSMDSYIQPLLTYVLRTDDIGVRSDRLSVDLISFNCGSTEADRFKLSIPYAKQNLVWDVFFDSQCPEIGPDFIFNDDTFLSDVDVDTLSSKIPSLATWNPNNKDALLNVLMELLACYKQHQIQLLQKHNRLHIEYTMLMESTDIKSKDIEVMLLPLGSKPIEAKFLISLSINVSQLPNYIYEPENDTAMLLVTFYGAEWNRIVPELYLPQKLIEILGGISELQLPLFPFDKFIIDYIPEIKKLVTDKINTLAQCFNQRREFLAVMLHLQHKSVLEYDSIEHTYIVMLLLVNTSSILLNLKLPLGFPRKPPIITVQSMYHVTEQNLPSTIIIETFPYDHQWNLHYMAEKILSYIKENIPKFICTFTRNIS